MKTVYRAANSVEGHMIQGLLEQAGLDARVDGDYLQGGAGELAPDGLIRVRVAQEQYDRARAIIDEWDARQVEETRYDTRPVRRSGGGTLSGVLIGFIAGVVLMWFVCSAGD